MIKRKSWPYRNVFSVLGLYYHLCSYGEDLKKPLFWLYLLITMGTLYWYGFFYWEFDDLKREIESSVTFSISSDIPIIKPSKSNDNLNKSKDPIFAYDTVTKKKDISMKNTTTLNEIILLKSFERTLTNIVSINDDLFFGDIIIRILSLIVLAATGITLRRKIERRFRH